MKSRLLSILFALLITFPSGYAKESQIISRLRTMLDNASNEQEISFILEIATTLEKEVLYPEKEKEVFYLDAGDYLVNKGLKKDAAVCYDLAASLGNNEGFLKKAGLLPASSKRAKWLTILGKCGDNNAKVLMDALKKCHSDINAALTVHDNLGYYHLEYLPDPLVAFRISENPQDLFVQADDSIWYHVAMEKRKAGKLYDASRLYAMLADSCNVDAIARSGFLWLDSRHKRKLHLLVWGYFMSEGNPEPLLSEKSQQKLKDGASSYLKYLRGETQTCKQLSAASDYMRLPEEKLLRVAFDDHYNNEYISSDIVRHIKGLPGDFPGHKFAGNIVRDAIEHERSHPHVKQSEKIIEALNNLPVDEDKVFSSAESEFYPYYKSGYFEKAHRSVPYVARNYPVGDMEEYTPPLVPESYEGTSKLEIVPQFGHVIKKCSVSESGKYALTSDVETSAILWEAETGRILRTYHDNYSDVEFINGFPEHLGTLGKPTGLTPLRDLLSGKILAPYVEYQHFNEGQKKTDLGQMAGKLKGAQILKAGNIELSPDGDELLVGGHTPFVLNLDKWEITTEIPLYQHMMRDGIMVDKGYDMPLRSDSPINSWGFGRRMAKGFLEGHYLPDGRLVFGSSRGEITIWDKNGELNDTINVGLPIVFGLRPFGDKVFCTTYGGNLIYGTLEDKQLDNTCVIPSGFSSVFDILFMPDRDEFYLAVNSHNPHLRKENGKSEITEIGLYRGRISDPSSELECIITQHSKRVDYGGSTCLSRIGDTPCVLVPSENYATIYNCETHHQTRLKARFEGRLSACCALGDGRILMGNKKGWVSVYNHAMLPYLKEDNPAVKEDIVAMGKARNVILRKPVVEGSLQKADSCFYVNEGEIRGIVEDRKRGLIYISSSTGVIQIRSLANLDKIANCYALGGGHHIIFTPDGYYMGTKESLDVVMYSLGGKLYGFDQFDLTRNRPDILRERLGASEQEVAMLRRIHEKRVRRMGLSLSDADPAEAPLLEVLDAPKGKVNVPEVLIGLAASDKSALLSRFLVWVNGAPVFGRDGLEIAGGVKEAGRQIRVPLSDGKNLIEISCLNSKGVESLRRALEVEYVGTKRRSTLYLVALGVSQYADAAYNLRYAAKDAEEMLSTMQINSRAYSAVKTLLLKNKEVNAEAPNRIKKFLENAGSNDAVIVFYAGHGLLDADYNYYLSLYGTDFSNPASTAMSYDDFEDLFDRILPQKRLVLIDACHSGEIDKEDVHEVWAAAKTEGKVTFRGAALGKESVESLAINGGYVDVRRGRGTTVFAGSSGLEVAMEGNDWQNGLFTWVVKRGLLSFAADSNSDGTVTVSELLDYAHKEVNRISGGTQSPAARSINRRNDFALAVR